MASGGILRGAGLLALGLLLSATPALAPAHAADGEPPFSEPKRQEIESIIRDYITNHPQVILDAVRQHQTNAAVESKVRVQTALISARDELENDPSSPTVGNKNGDVTIVEFFDYQCGYCKSVFPDVRDLIETDGNIRYVLKEFPVLGPPSTIAARASLAVWAEYPERYFDYHAALMSVRGTLSEERVLKVAEDLGMNPNQLRSTMFEPKIDNKILSVRDLATRLELRGTPAFVIGDEVIPGAVSPDALKDLIDRARRS